MGRFSQKTKNNFIFKVIRIYSIRGSVCLALYSKERFLLCYLHIFYLKFFIKVEVHFEGSFNFFKGTLRTPFNLIYLFIYFCFSDTDDKGDEMGGGGTYIENKQMNIWHPTYTKEAHSS